MKSTTIVTIFFFFLTYGNKMKKLKKGKNDKIYHVIVKKCIILSSQHKK